MYQEECLLLAVRLYFIKCNKPFRGSKMGWYRAQRCPEPWFLPSLSLSFPAVSFGVNNTRDQRCLPWFQASGIHQQCPVKVTFCFSAEFLVFFFFLFSFLLYFFFHYHLSPSSPSLPPEFLRSSSARGHLPVSSHWQREWDHWLKWVIFTQVACMGVDTGSNLRLLEWRSK